MIYDDMQRVMPKSTEYWIYLYERKATTATEQADNIGYRYVSSDKSINDIQTSVITSITCIDLENDIYHLNFSTVTNRIGLYRRTKYTIVT